MPPSNEFVWENSAKNVNQTGNFHQNVKPPFVRQYIVFFNIFFLIRDHTSIIILIQKSKFEENWRSEGIQ